MVRAFPVARGRRRARRRVAARARRARRAAGFRFARRGTGREGLFEAAGRSAEASGAARDPNVTRHKYPVSPSRRETAASLPPALAATLGALASEEGAASLGDDETADSIRCWSLLACSCVGADACEGGVGGARASPPRSSRRSPNPTPNRRNSAPRSRSRPRTCASSSRTARASRRTARSSPRGARPCSRARRRAARRPPKAAATSFRSAPAPTIRLGAGVTRRALRATLRWAYSGALPFPADVSDGLFLSRDGGDGSGGRGKRAKRAREARVQVRRATSSRTRRASGARNRARASAA